MSLISHLQCIRCGTQYPADTVMNLCPLDNSPVEIIMDLERLMTEQPDQSWYQPERSDMWRFGGLLPLDINNPDDQPHIFNLGEGHTPLLDYSDHPLANQIGFTLLVKDEGKAHAGFGANPTQSFKDRGMAMTISMAHKAGIKKLAVPTQGNAGDSMCEYANAADMQAVVAMPDNTPMPILGRVAALASQSDRFDLELVTGTIREAGLLLKEKWLDKGYFSVATFQEPGWRIDGKKTLGLELAEPEQSDGPWSLPDVVIYPTGGGTGVLGNNTTGTRNTGIGRSALRLNTTGDKNTAVGWSALHDNTGLWRQCARRCGPFQGTGHHPQIRGCRHWYCRA